MKKLVSVRVTLGQSFTCVDCFRPGPVDCTVRTLCEHQDDCSNKERIKKAALKAEHKKFHAHARGPKLLKTCLSNLKNSGNKVALELDNGGYTTEEKVHGQARLNSKLGLHQRNYNEEDNALGHITTFAQSLIILLVAIACTNFELRNFTILNSREPDTDLASYLSVIAPIQDHLLKKLRRSFANIHDFSFTGGDLMHPQVLEFIGRLAKLARSISTLTLDVFSFPRGDGIISWASSTFAESHIKELTIFGGTMHPDPLAGFLEQYRQSLKRLDFSFTTFRRASRSFNWLATNLHLDSFAAFDLMFDDCRPGPDRYYKFRVEGREEIKAKLMECAEYYRACEDSWDGDSDS